MSMIVNYAKRSAYEAAITLINDGLLKGHYISVPDAADQAGVSTTAIYKAISNQKLRGRRIGGDDHYALWLISVTDLEEWQNNRRDE